MGTVWNVMIDLKLGDDCDVKEMVKSSRRTSKERFQKAARHTTLYVLYFKTLKKILMKCLSF